MRTFAIVNQKGGCGKTTTAINLAGVFASRGYRTLLVDMDPQGHCAAGLAIPENRIDLHVGDALTSDQPVDASRLLWRVSRNLDLAPATVRLAALEAPRGELAGKPESERRLKALLDRFGHQYDICLIDCSPAIGLLAYNALVAADQVLIPVETGFFALQGATKQVSAIKALGKRLGVTPVHRILATMHDPASMLSKEMLEELQRRFTGKMAPVVIRFDTALKEAASFGQPVIEYSPDSNGAKDYGALADWLVSHVLNGADRAAAAETEAPEPETIAAAEAMRPVVIEAPTTTRAADLVSRAKKLQNRAAESAVASAAAASVEIKPIAVEPAPASMTPPVAEMSSPGGAAESAAFGPQVTPTGVIFRIPATMGRSAAIAGDFNQWMPERTPMRPGAAGVLECAAFMPPGSTSQYRLVIDGQWIADPFNPCNAPNPFGGTNSVVSVPVMRSAGAMTGMMGVEAGTMPTIVVRSMDGVQIGRPA